MLMKIKDATKIKDTKSSNVVYVSSPFDMQMQPAHKYNINYNDKYR